MKLFLFSIFLCTFAREIHEISHARMGCTSAESMLSALGLHHPCIAFEAQMAESVDALVSNTSGATRAGSTPALGTVSTTICWSQNKAKCCRSIVCSTFSFST